MMSHDGIDRQQENKNVLRRLYAEFVDRGAFSGIPATGRPVAFSAISIYRFKAGKIAELWVQVDRLGLLQQLGAVPQPAPARAVRA